MTTISTSGELRLFLAEVLIGIKDGSIDANKAQAIAKVSAQINQSLAVDVKIASRSDDAEPGSLEGGRPLTIANATVWCEQCDKRVSTAHASSCASQFCKAKAA